MGVLRGIERRLQGAVDYAFTRVFGGSVQPAEVSGALQDEADRHLQRQGARTIAPNRYIVHLGPSDSSAVGDDEQRVAAAFSTMIGRYVDENGWDTFGAVAVTLDQSDMLHTGQFRISALVDPDAGPRRASDHAGAGLMTRNTGQGGDRPAMRDDAVPPAHHHAAPQPSSQPYPQQYPPPPHTPQPYPGGYPSNYPGGYPNSPNSPNVPNTPSAPNTPNTPDYAGGWHRPQTPNTPYPDYRPPAPPPPRQASLTVQDGSGRTLQLQQGSNILGRDQGAALRLPDTSVSRRHADVYFDGRTAIVHDLGSTNGTLVNGSPVQTWQLADGDVIELGRCTLAVTVR